MLLMVRWRLLPSWQTEKGPTCLYESERSPRGYVSLDKGSVALSETLLSAADSGSSLAAGISVPVRFTVLQFQGPIASIKHIIREVLTGRP